MKRINKAFLIFLFIIWPPLSQADDNVIYLTSNEFPPYHGEHLLHQGPVIELIRAVFMRVGYKVEIEFLPWARGEHEARKGIYYDGVVSIWRTTEREKWYLYSASYMKNEVGLYKRKADSIKYKNYQDLMTYKIGTVIAYANPPGFDQAKLDVKEVVADSLNIAKLCHERIDLVLIDKRMAEHIIKTIQQDCENMIEWLEPALEIKPMYVAISKKAKNAHKKIADFNRGLQLLKNDGTFKAILNKHGF